MSDSKKESLHKEIENVNKKQEVRDDFEISEEFMEEARRALNAQGPLFVDPKYHKPGYVLEWTLDVPGNINRKERMGFKVVQDENLRFGDERPNQASRLGSAVICMWKSTTPLVLMEIDAKRHKAIQLAKREKVVKTEQAMGQVKDIPVDYTYGEITGHKKS